jgi:quercetin dioxygenase-like cupin family protein
MNALFELRTKLESEGYAVSLHLLAPGTVFGEHCACGRRVDAVLSGQLRLVIGGEARLLGPGDWVEVPAGVQLSAEVIGEEPVIALDASREPA